jgi:hypothetical protein
MTHRFRTMHVVLSVLLAAATPAGAAETRYHQHGQKAKGSGGAVRVLAATYFGGPSIEEFVAAGIAADGTVIVVGNAWGPEFPKVNGLAVIGTDQHTGAPPYEKDGKKINTASPDIAAFVLRYAPGMDGIQGAVRMGWGNASASHATIAPDGTVYLSGRCTAAFRAALGAKAEVVPPPDGAGKGTDLYLACLPPKAAAPAWAKIFEKAEEASNGAERHVGGQAGVRALLRGEGELVLVAHGRLYVLNLGTKALKELGPTKGGVLHAVDKEGNAYLGGDENTNTGREPWRRPFLYKIDRSGKVAWEVWRWNSKEVGTDTYRLVSDSSVRHVGFGPDGKMVVAGWSDGGNSVFDRQPTSLDSPLKYGGFIDSLWGAGVGTFSRLMRLEGDPPKLLDGTVWCSFLTDKNKPNSAAIDSMAMLDDGRVAVGGGTSFALVETPDAWAKSFPNGTGGANLSIFSADLKDLLFSTVLPTAERRVALGRSGTRLVVACRAKADEAATLKPILVKPLQEKIAGEWDGYVVLVETK